MPTSNRSVFRCCSRVASVTDRTAVYGPVRTVVWQGSAGDRRPYADHCRVSFRPAFRDIKFAFDERAVDEVRNGKTIRSRLCGDNGLVRKPWLEWPFSRTGQH